MFSKAVVIVLFLLALEINSKPPELERYRGKVAMVTGASMGIGFATTIALLQAGIDVVGVARRGGYEQSITRALPIENSDNFGKFYPVQCDITDEKKLLEIFRWIDAKLGGVSIMINNAGVIERATLIGGESAAWRKVWELNVLALTVCTKAAISSMNRHMSLDGHIIHMSSIAAYSMVTAMGHKMYNASKVAVRVLADGLRHELQLYDSKIKVSCICPGLVDTDLLNAESHLKDFYPQHFFLKAETVAKAVLYVLDTPRDVLVAELMLVAAGMTIQDHSVAPGPHTI